MKISIWHNIMWSRYKAVVFSSLFRLAAPQSIDLSVYQIAETESNRIGLAPLDKSWHEYPYTLLFPGASSSIPRWQLYHKMLRLTAADRADVTILSGYEKPEVWLQALLLTLARRRFAFFCDSTIYDKPQAFLKGIAKRIFFNWADGAFCYGVRAAEYVAHYGVHRDKIFNRCQAAALPRDYTSETAIQQRIAIAPSPNSPNYLYVGRLSSEKSVDHVIKAFAMVVSTISRAKLTLIGSGPELASLRSLASDLSIEKKVIFSGSKYDEDLFAEYSKATCLVLPSQSEPWGLVVNEALSYGCPAIVSDRCGCVPELILNSTTGFVYEWGDLTTLASHMLAAPEVFANVERTADACLKQIKPFTPDAAAKSILDGCRIIAAMDN